MPLVCLFTYIFCKGNLKCKWKTGKETFPGFLSNEKSFSYCSQRSGVKLQQPYCAARYRNMLFAFHSLFFHHQKSMCFCTVPVTDPISLHPHIYLISMLAICRRQHSRSCDFWVRICGAHSVSRNILVNVDVHSNIHKRKERS